MWTAFKKMVSLEGEWDGTDANGQKVHSSFRSVVSGTTLMEMLSPKGMEEMLSLYPVDGDAIQLAYYCLTNHQPRMKAVPSSANPDELNFQFTGAGNLYDISIGHHHRLVFRFEDSNPLSRVGVGDKQTKTRP